MAAWGVDVIVCERDCSKEERALVVSFSMPAMDVSAFLPFCGAGDTVFPFARHLATRSLVRLDMLQSLHLLSRVRLLAMIFLIFPLHIM